MAGSPIDPPVGIADTSFLYAVMDKHSQQHQEASQFYDDFPGRILLPALILAELSYLLQQVGGIPLVIAAMRSIRDSQVEIVDPVAQDYDRALVILTKYHDSRIDFVDACIMALAERLKVIRVLTFDRRDFGVYRPAHCERFELLP